MKSKTLALLVLVCSFNLVHAATSDAAALPTSGMRGVPEVLAQWTMPTIGSSPMLASVLAGMGLVAGLARRRLHK